MKTTAANLIRLARVSALIAGLCYIVVGLFHPANTPASVTTTSWVLVHIAACAMSFFGLLGLGGMHARQAVRTGWIGLTGYVLLSSWFVLIMGFSFVEAFILPRVATAAPSFVDAWMGMFNGPAGPFDLGVLPSIWAVTGPLYILGGLLFGIATVRAGVLPRLAGALLALSTALAPLAGILPNASQPKIAIVMGVALAWLGYSLMTEHRTVPVESLSRAPAKSV